MTDKKNVHTENAPAALGPYSQAIISNGMLFTSGQIPINPATNEMLTGGIEEQTHQVLKNLQAVLAEAGVGFEAVLKTTVFLTDLADFATVNGIYAEYMTEPFPARSCVQVAALPKDSRIEIELIARLPE